MPESVVKSYIPEISFVLATNNFLPDDHILDDAELKGSFYGARVTFLRNSEQVRFANQMDVLAFYFNKTAHLRDLIIRNAKTVIRNIKPEIIVQCNQRQVLLANAHWGSCFFMEPCSPNVAKETQTDPEDGPEDSTDPLEVLARVSQELEKLDA